MPQTADQIIAQNMRIWGLRLIYILSGKVSVNFPGATRAHPSAVVYVQLANTGLFREGDRRYFPFQVHWKVWHDQILPVLADPANQLGVPINRIRLDPSLLNDLIEQYAGVLEAHFREGGVLPP